MGYFSFFSKSKAGIFILSNFLSSLIKNSVVFLAVVFKKVVKTPGRFEKLPSKTVVFDSRLGGNGDPPGGYW